MFFPVPLAGLRYEVSMCFSVPFFGGGHFLWLFDPVPCTFGDVVHLFRSEVCQFVVVSVVVGVIVFVVGVMDVIVVAFPVVGWGSATVAAAAWRHRERVAVLAGVLRAV